MTPEQTGGLGTTVHNIYIRPGTDYLVASYYAHGTQILDVSDPANMTRAAYYDTTSSDYLFNGNWGTYAYLPSGTIISSSSR